MNFSIFKPYLEKNANSVNTELGALSQALLSNIPAEQTALGDEKPEQADSSVQSDIVSKNVDGIKDDEGKVFDEVFQQLKIDARRQEQQSKYDITKQSMWDVLKQAVTMERKYSCILIPLSGELSSAISETQQKIDKKDLYTEEKGYGLETEPYVTVLYGLHTNDFDKVQERVDNKHLTVDEIDVSVDFSNLKKFDNNPKFDVLYFPVEKTESLVAVNKYFSDNFEYTNKYKEYNPHATVAYLKKGKADKYISEYTPVRKNKVSTKVGNVNFSNQSGEHTPIYLRKEKVASLFSVLSKPFSLARKAIGVAALPVVGETALRSGQNIYEGIASGDPSKIRFEGPITTGSMIGSGLNTLMTLTGVKPAIGATTQSVAEGLLTTPTVKNALQTAQQVLSPEGRAAIGDTVSEATQGVVEGAAKGSLTGFGKALKERPGVVLAALLASASPMIAYDLLTRQQRRSNAEMNKAVLDYLTRSDRKSNKKKVKTAALSSKLWKSFRLSPQSIQAAIDESGNIDPARLKKIIRAENFKPEHQSLLNNVLTRYAYDHPYKTMLGGTALVGAGVTGLAAASNNENTAMETLRGAGKGVWDTVKEVEHAAMQGTLVDNLKKNKEIAPQIAQVQDIGNSLKNAYSFVKGNVAKAKSPEHAAEMLTGGAAASSKDDKSIYALGALGILLPTLTYLGYKHFGEKDLKQLENEKERLTTILAEKRKAEEDQKTKDLNFVDKSTHNIKQMLY